jgi:chromosome segregation ATPase
MFRIVQQTLVPALDGQEAPRNSVRDTAEPARNDRAEASNDDRQLEMQSLRVQLQATEAQLRERSAAAATATLDLASARRDFIETKAALAALGNALDDLRADLRDTELQMSAGTVDLANAKHELALISNSARRFIRQYLPKLRRHLALRLLIARPKSSD